MLRFVKKMKRKMKDTFFKLHIRLSVASQKNISRVSCSAGVFLHGACMCGFFPNTPDSYHCTKRALLVKWSF